MAAPVRYKTSAVDASQMVNQWYAMVPDVAAQSGPKDTAWWVKQIQQDGSHTAFLNFANGISQQHGPQAAQELTTAVAAQTKQTGLPPWTPAQGATNGQLPGTNTKSVGAEIGSAVTSPVGKAIEGVVAGALDFVSGGALTPLTTAGLAALQGGGTALQPGSQAGGIIGGALSGAGEGALAGGVAGLAGAAGVPGYGAASALPTVSSANIAKMAADGTLAGAANASAPITAANAADLTSALPNVPGLPSTQSVLNTGKQVAGAAGAGGVASQQAPSSQGGNSLVNLLGTTLPTVLGGLNVANLQNASMTNANNAIASQTGLWNNVGQPLIASGQSGMKSALAMAPGMPNIQALNSIASTGNPFAPNPQTAPPPASPLPSVSSVGGN